MDKAYITKILNEFSEKNKIAPSKVVSVLNDYESIKNSISSIDKKDIEKIKQEIGNEKISELTEIIKSIK